MSLEQEKEIIKLEKYLRKQGRDELVQELRAINNDQKRLRLMGQAIHEQEIIDTREIDEALKEAKAQVKELGKSYNEQSRMVKKISRFIHLLIEDSGKE